MTTHPALLAQLLDDEVEVARSRLRDRATGVKRVGTTIRVPLSAPDGGPLCLVLDGANFDAEPSLGPSPNWMAPRLRSSGGQLGWAQACTRS
jgi:hypothetical protein